MPWDLALAVLVPFRAPLVLSRLAFPRGDFVAFGVTFARVTFGLGRLCATFAACSGSLRLGRIDWGGAVVLGSSAAMVCVGSAGAVAETGITGVGVIATAVGDTAMSASGLGGGGAVTNGALLAV